MVAINRVSVSSWDMDIWTRGYTNSLAGSAACAIPSRPRHLSSRKGKRGCEAGHLPQRYFRIKQRASTPDRCGRSWAGAQGELVDSANSGPLGLVNGAITARPRVDIWSTASAREHERFSYWCEAIGRSMFNISMEEASERFTARLTTRRTGALGFARSESSDYRMVRSRRDVDSAPSDHWTIYLQMRGRTLFEQAGDMITLDRDDIAMLDGRMPFRAAFSPGGLRAVAKIPRQTIDHRAPWLSRH